ncbi:pyridoxamine 5'-phosphate oxidase [Bosea caraganae]|uniref:Pyridoxamine 5'-phosphate oxidase n=1 Tax=Bosea caraganae TaxID=2763117 RepID=A0A370L6E9_9HYPH|nr:pyridoxamine 5'-phosphate oxidase family protein [Bosea caraganae]RDJ25306.1 pyridoxamine 5'-phosphate oxidase [Bosea caraganae]RDJ25911.1 pyridoxamine 5'-phosphate oxidase [Bosea caraganae]
MDAQPFHPGELAAQARAGISSRGAGIREFMPAQHRDFFTLLPYLFAAGRDAQGWPIATVLAGEAGFVLSPAATSLSIAALPSPDDPADAALRTGAPVGLLGLDFNTRRRNRANGTISLRDGRGFDVAVAQSFGNCAKYIQTRDSARVATMPRPVETLSGLDTSARRLIAGADTLFIASASADGVDISHRGGRPGFVRIDGDTLTVPDFTGNAYFNTLGNLLLEPRAALLFVDFSGGDILQLQGETEIVWDGPELGLLEGAERLWRFRVTRGWRQTGALPLRWSTADPAPTTLATGLWQARTAA